MAYSDRTGVPSTATPIDWICAHTGLRRTYIAACLGRQPGSLSRSLRGNCPVSVLHDIAWALGIEAYWLLVPPEKLEQHFGKELVIPEDAPVRAVQAEREQVKREAATRARPMASPEEAYPEQARRAYEQTPTSAAERQRREDEQLAAELNEGCPPGYRLSDEAIRTYRVPYARWLEGGWTDAALIGQGFLVEDDSQSGV